MKSIILILAFVCVGSAETTAERELRRELAAANAKVESLANDKAKLTESISKMKVANTVTSTTVAAVAEAKKALETQVDATKQAGAIAAAGVDSQVSTALAASQEARRAASEAKVQANQFLSGNTSLIIVQFFLFMTVLAGFIYKGFEHHWDNVEKDRREQVAADNRKADGDTFQLMLSRQLAIAHAAADVAAIQGAKLDQVHTLVNSSLTAAMLAALEALKSNSILLQEAIDAKKIAGIEPSAESLNRVTEMLARVSGLEAQLKDRETQTLLAARQLEEKK